MNLTTGNPASGSVRIVMAQLDFLVGDIAGNVQRVIESSIRARDELSAHAIVFPELTLTGYPPEDLLLRPGLHVRVLEGLESIRQGIDNIHVVVGHPNETPAGLFNAASVFYNGSRLAIYSKQQLPNYGVFDEKRYFVAGNNPCVVDICGLRVGITLCEDLWVSGPVEQAVAAGAQLVVNLNASPFHAGKTDEREDEVQRRVQESRVPILYVNLVGGQDELVFDGESFAMDASGEVVCRAPACEEALATVTIHSPDVRLEGGEVAQRADAVAAMYRVLVLGVRDYVQKNGFTGAVLGLSGGIDSALTLVIAADALGAGKVEAVMMPSRYTSTMSQEDAREQAQLLEVKYSELSIEPAFNSFLETLKESFAGRQADTTEENIQARCRGILLMAISNKKRNILLTTGNKSEMAVGYATLYGDMAGGFAPIKDVPKTLVYKLAEYRNTIKPVIPQRVLDRPPSAELAPDQVDQDSLPPYDVLDSILDAYVENDQCIEEIVTAGFDEAVVRRVVSMVDANEYKRRQAPPGVRITRRAFGRDRRYPITSGFNKKRN